MALACIRAHLVLELTERVGVRLMLVRHCVGNYVMCGWRVSTTGVLKPLSCVRAAHVPTGRCARHLALPPHVLPPQARTEPELVAAIGEAQKRKGELCFIMVVTHRVRHEA